ncbi:MAG: DUF4124 domain-containing protein [Burkholderiaceae bacterium]|nr:DUF4124 domain-containing protein [Burkholderiaceae bacterium]
MKPQVWKRGAAVGLLGLCAHSAAQNIYTCTDAKGRRLTSDRLISECLDREQYELNASGLVRRTIGPSLTEQERAALEAQQRKQQEERNRVQEEHRRERALLARYPDKGSHDAERAEAIKQIDDVALIAEKHVAELLQERKALDLEMEFYQKDPGKAPLALRRKLALNQEAIQDQRRFLANQGQEKRRVHARFDAELLQLRKLWEASRPAVPPAPGGKDAGPQGTAPAVAPR